MNNISSIKGIHPGVILDRELKKRKLSKGRFALSLGVYPQTLSAITNGKRGMNIPLSIKAEEALGLEEGFFMTLQVFYDIKEEKHKQQINRHPDLSKIRRVIFWDTPIEKIDWENQKRPVIKRIFERGNQLEKEEITRFYGKQTIAEILSKEGDQTFH